LIEVVMEIQCQTTQRGDMGMTVNRSCIYILIGAVEIREQFLDVTSDCIDMVVVGSGSTTMPLGVMGEQEADQRHQGSVGCRGSV
jgi:hypothetical protein